MVVVTTEGECTFKQWLGAILFQVYPSPSHLVPSAVWRFNESLPFEDFVVVSLDSLLVSYVPIRVDVSYSSIGRQYIVIRL